MLEVIITDNEDKLNKVFLVYQELRPHFENSTAFINAIQKQWVEGFKIYAAIQKELVYGCIGLRTLHTTAWGKVLYIDDLIISSRLRGNGVGNLLLDFAINLARKNECNQIHLDTGYQRFTAHKVYLNKGFQLNCHHLALDLN